MSTTASTTASPSAPAAAGRVDPRGQRFAAALTAGLFAVALVQAPSALTVVLLGVQLVVFAIGATVGPASTPYAWLFKTFVRPRIGPPRELEDAGPPRCAQTVGLGFAVVALGGYAVGLPLLGAVAAGMALGAAFLNAAFGFCLGCELYLWGKRASTRRVLDVLTDAATH